MCTEMEDVEESRNIVVYGGGGGGRREDRRRFRKNGMSM
jgi:hypothetical protein